MRRAWVAAAVLVVAGCADASAAPVPDYLGQEQVPHGYEFDGTTVGGLSAISYDPSSGLYYVISDDRSEHDPARFYTARIALSDSGIDGVELVATHPWLTPQGGTFPPLDVDASAPAIPPDAEGIALDPARQQLYWSSEGERITDTDQPVLLDPSVRIAGLDGSFLGEFELPPDLRMSAEDTGPRRNNALEGLTLSADGTTLFAAMEEPTYSDGALTRITALDVETRKPVAQYAYSLDAPFAGAGSATGLSDLVALGDGSFLVIERGYGTQVAARIYRAVIGGATNILGQPAGGAAMTKTLMVDLTQAVAPLDNVEGITLGPLLPDGRQSVVLVSDDNFSPAQITQFLLLAI